ncbi:MAG: hypothetical protein K2X03_12900 [Bryobacteraceae bacterium]|nr:hypothetical protein [Bryobacteraceae bacterium]
MKRFQFALATLAFGLCSCGPKGGGASSGSSSGGGGDTNPVPVTLISPADRPGLNVNGFLLSNGTVIGCNEWQKTTVRNGPFSNLSAAKLAGGSTGVTNPLSHDEPPIGGGDGSFILTMSAQKGLAGTNDTTLKACGIEHDDTGGTWALLWKIWNPDGSTSDSGTQDLPLPNLTQAMVEVLFNDTSQKVTISRSTSSLGSAWQVQSGQASFKASSVISGFATDSIVSELDLANASALRMTKLIVSGTSKTSTPFNSVTVNLDRNGKTCAGFVICHDEQNGKCPAIAQPKACSSTSGGGVVTNPKNVPKPTQ